MIKIRVCYNDTCFTRHASELPWVEIKEEREVAPVVKDNMTSGFVEIFQLRKEC